MFNNCVFVLDQINNVLPNTFSSYFRTLNITQNYVTRGNANFNVSKPIVKTSTYGLKSLTYKAAADWNKIQTINKKFNYQEEIINRNKFIM